eukprot:1334303-Amphidinium_carterae.1
MEPEQLAPYGYEVQDSKGVRDRLDTSANSTNTNIRSSTTTNQSSTIARRIGEYQSVCYLC